MSLTTLILSPDKNQTLPFHGPLITISKIEATSTVQILIDITTIKMVPESFHGKFFGGKVNAVKLIGGGRFLAARSGLSKSFTQIMAIWTPAITL